MDLKDTALSRSLHAWWKALSPQGSPLTQQLYNAFAQWLVEVGDMKAAAGEKGARASTNARRSDTKP